MENVNVNSEEKGQDLFNYLAFRFTPYWPLFIGLLLVGAAAAWLYIRTATPLYRTTATIMLKDERKGVDDAKILEALNVYTKNKIVENEIEVIRSRSLMKLVVEQLDLYAPVYSKGSLRDQNIYGNSPIKIDAKRPGKLPNTEKIDFTYDRQKQTVSFEGNTYKAGEWNATPYGELKFTFDTTINYDLPDPLYFQLYNSVSYSAGLTAGLTVSPSNKSSTVLYLSFIDESPERGKDVLNKLSANYAQATINEKNELAANTLSFIEERLSYLVREIDSIEHTIQAYKSQQGIVSLSDEGRLFLNNVGDNDRKLGNINMQLAVLDQVERYVISKNKKAGLVPSTLGLTDEGLTKLVQRLYESELQYERLRQTMAENSPAVTTVANEIDAVRPAILENVNNQRQALLASRQGLTQTNGQYSSMIKTIPVKERKLLEISREQTIKNGVYTYLLQKREETALSASTAVADSRLIDPAVATWLQVSPNPTYVYGAAIVVAILIGVLFVLLFEFLPGRIMFRSDIEKHTSLPVVAEITSLKKKGELVVNTQDRAYTGEQFRQLRAAIGLYGRKVPKHTLLVTSSIAGEGKSFVASNLALSLSMSGKKVIIVDADFRSPKTSSNFEVENNKGFTEYLQDEISAEEAILKTSFSNLFILPAGGVVNNPTELLLNGKLNELFEFLQSEFDFVIVDTSPVAPVTDAYVLSDYCDKTLYVIRHRYTPKALIKVLEENTRMKALKNINIVFNGVKKRGFTRGGYGFGYGYGHEYVYKERTARKS